MNTAPTTPGVGGFLFNGKPLWHPPISPSWILTLILVVLSANADELPVGIQKIILHPAGFFAILIFSLLAYDNAYPHICFSLLFLILMVWAMAKRNEGFNPSGTLDWVTNDKRWFSEVVLKEKPIAIQEKDVATYPVQGS